MDTFTIFPAIDLRKGQVVRLRQGDPNQQTNYSSDPELIARKMLAQGARWLHVVNLDGAFGDSSDVNHRALAKILQTAREFTADVQFGGGMHTVEQVKQVLDSGVSRAILGSLAVKDPESVRSLVAEFGAERIAVSLDGRKNKVMVAGWQKESDVSVTGMAAMLRSMGLEWLVYTDIDRDGMQTGSDFETTISIARETGLKVIASGGVCSLNEVRNLKQNGAAGAIIGKALYEGSVELADLLAAALEGD
ncbi:1-(5-phosphoribosyl)-5-[(5-phosphoribosylamino) methylideneamino] imidazole-4-carboxamide isomerase [Leptolinea sp. HRD-7]|nr:1-(5-phosphoribosyl)-5-[(5-phosphoribosylamino)methylideneamino]imidazole-4-carboxamide isomerase [bacterium]BCY19042.1 1-(5-phosphoribosyl)-5-[(5-phosphoribosylamino) methylideneamino] imidazole-4-carboxamide isomerase [Leptolinea sp. HRD-7]